MEPDFNKTTIRAKGEETPCARKNPFPFQYYFTIFHYLFAPYKSNPQFIESDLVLCIHCTHESNSAKNTLYKNLLMKKNVLLLFCSLLISIAGSSQVVCVLCYNQNDSISSGVNNLIHNGGFESTNCIPNNWFASSYCPNSAYYNCGFQFWTCTGGGPSTYADAVDSTFTVLPEGQFGAYLGNSFCEACSNSSDLSCIVDEGCIVTGIPDGFPLNQAPYGLDTGISLEQTVLGLIVGKVYVLEFWVGGEHFGSFPDQGIFAVDVGFGNFFLRNNGTNAGTGIGTRYLIEFIAASSQHTFKFTNWGHICPTCTELILDDVRLYVIEELSPIIPPCPTGVNSVDANLNFKIYPNPVLNQLTISSEVTETFSFRLFDLTSRKIIEKQIHGSEVINLPNMKSGLYFYEVSNGKGMLQQGKIVKE